MNEVKHLAVGRRRMPIFLTVRNRRENAMADLRAVVTDMGMSLSLCRVCS